MNDRVADAIILSGVGDLNPAPDHSAFWNEWLESFAAREPELTERTNPDPSDPSATHGFIGAHGVRVGCSLVTDPTRPIRAGLVVVHGSMVTTLERERHHLEQFAQLGLAVLSVRVRGFPGSRTADGGPIGWSHDDRAWVTRGLVGGSHGDWVLPRMVGDVADAVRVLKRVVGGREVFVSGRSLGGGLAVLAAAQLNGRYGNGNMVSRLAIACPSLGSLRSRIEGAPSGLAAPIRALIDQDESKKREILDRVRLCDATIHARRVRVPTLAMLALSDPVVPPGAAAGIYNALGTDPGRKWRCIVPIGHDARAPGRPRVIYRKVRRTFLDPSQTPIESMAAWEESLGSMMG